MKRTLQTFSRPRASNAHLLLATILAAVPACDCHNAKLATVCGISITPSTEDFGSVALNQAVTLPLTIKNSGSAPLTIESAVASGDNSFQVESLASSQVTPGSSQQVQITFTPSTAGPHTATLLITTDDSCANPTNTVTLTGIGVNYGVTVTPSSLDLGCVAKSGQSTAQTVTLTNASNPAEPETVTLVPDNTGDFQLTPPQTTFVLAAGGGYQFSVTFSPTAIGATPVTWSIIACGEDAGCTTVSLPLTGTGSDTVLVATPDAGDFGSVPVGDSVSLGFVVQAVSLPAGSACAVPVTVDLPSLAFGDAGFALGLDAGWDGGWPTTLAPPAAFPFFVTFTGGDGGAFADQAVVPYMLAGPGQNPRTLIVPLIAQAGTGPCSLKVDPETVSFGTVPLGETTPEQGVNVTNAGDAFCTVTGALVNDLYDEFAFGAGTADFADGGTIALAPGQSADINLTFTAVNVMFPDLRYGKLHLTADVIGGTGIGSALDVPLSATVTAIIPGLGCSDGTREGFTDQTLFPAIAGCSGGWAIAGLSTPSACGLDAGNSSANPDGIGCAAADLCATGFHICTSSNDVANHLDGGSCSAITTTPGLFFATEQSGPGCTICNGADGQVCGGLSLCGGDPDMGCVDDLFGCGTAGLTPDSTCGALTMTSGNACDQLLPAGAWSCGPDNLSNDTEFDVVTKLSAAGGGVICCSD